MSTAVRLSRPVTSSAVRAGTNLPTSTTPFIGRRRELRTLASLFDPVESRNTVNVDQNGWADHAEIHHWKQTLPARDDFAFSACLGKCRHRFIDGLRENIVEGDRFHIIRP